VRNVALIFDITRLDCSAVLTETTQHRYKSIRFGAPVTEFCPPHNWCSLVHPLWGVDILSPHLKNGRKNLANHQ